MQGPGKRLRAIRARRRARLAVSFTRVLAHRPMFSAPYGKAREDNPRDEAQLEAADHWQRAIVSWRDKWAAARKDSATLRLGRRAKKAHLARLKAERVQAQRFLATTVAGVAGLRFTRV